MTLKMKKLFTIIALFFSLQFSAQETDLYRQVYDYINKMLHDEVPVSFKHAVWATESVFYDGNLDIEVLNDEINILIELTNILATIQLIEYEGKDKNIVEKHAALFYVLTDSVVIPFDSTNIFIHPPYTYDFNDALGLKDWSNMFVSKLLKTGKGNCHSLPYLYKILSDELKIPCQFAFAPNHIYIKLFSEKTRWYNVELTSATFPIDAWIMASGYISLDAIRSGLYMDALNEKQMLANCLLDLAHGYQSKFGKKDIDFVILCCNTLLEYHPANVSALHTKAEAQKRHIHSLMKSQNVNNPEDLFDDETIKAMYDEMTSIYIGLHNLGYRQMPKEMYMQWLKSPVSVSTSF
jgi:hypothetical protein